MAENKNLTIWLSEHEEEMKEDIRRLVRIPSVSVLGEEAAPYGEACKQVLQEMESIGAKYGFQTENHENRCVSISFGSGAVEIGIWGHLDVVPAGGEWIYPPFEGRQAGDFLVGRGTQDNKGPAVAVLYALRYLKESGYAPGVRYRQILGSSEECGMEDAEYYLKHYPTPAYSFVSDCSFPVCHGEKGICTLVLRTFDVPREIQDIQGGTASNAVPERAEAVLYGKRITGRGLAGHAAFPEGTQNAIGVLCRRLLEEKQIAGGKAAVEFPAEIGRDGYGTAAGIHCSDELSGKLTCNLGKITKKTTKGVPFWELELDIRYPVTACWEEIYEKLQQYAGRFGYEIFNVNHSTPSYVPETSDFVRILTESFRQVLPEADSRPYIMGGGTYARKIPGAVGFGPGLKQDFAELKLPEGHGNCHSADEAQSVTALRTAVQIYAAAFQKLDTFYKNNHGEER